MPRASNYGTELISSVMNVKKTATGKNTEGKMEAETKTEIKMETDDIDTDIDRKVIVPKMEKFEMDIENIQKIENLFCSVELK